MDQLDQAVLVVGDDATGSEQASGRKQTTKTKQTVSTKCKNIINQYIQNN
jgi:hypothetical protein